MIDDPAPYRDEYLKLLDAHLANREESDNWEERQARLVSILQTLFQINPTKASGHGIERLTIRRLKVYVNELV